MKKLKSIPVFKTWLNYKATNTKQHWTDFGCSMFQISYTILSTTPCDNAIYECLVAVLH